MAEQGKPDFLYGTATGIGSLPHTDVNAALSLIGEALPRGPHWPQLPRRGREEGFTRQYLHALEKLQLINLAGDTPFFYDREGDWAARLEHFYSLLLQAEQEEVPPLFAFPPGAAEGFFAFEQGFRCSRFPAAAYIKGQLSGPLSLGLQVRAADQSAAFYHPELREVICHTLALIARRQVCTLKGYGRPVLMFIDEPALLSYGQSVYVSLSRVDIKTALEVIIRAILAEGGYAGVHCCSGADWSILFELPLHVVSFDAYNYFPSMLVYARELEGFLQRGGCLAWGLVPTSGDSAAEGEEALLQRFDRGVRRLADRGVTQGLLREQYLLTPSCGTGTLEIEQAEQIYRLTARLQQRLGGAL